MLINDKISQLGQRLLEVVLVRLVDKLVDGTTESKPKDFEKEDNENEQRLIEEWL